MADEVENYVAETIGKIVTRGYPQLKKCHGLLESAVVGDLVACAGNDYDIVKVSAEYPNPIGFLGYEHTTLLNIPKTIETPYQPPEGDSMEVTVISGANYEIRARVSGAVGESAADAVIGNGTKLSSNGDGTLKAAVAGDVILAIAQESVTIPAAATGAANVVRIAVQALI